MWSTVRNTFVVLFCVGVLIAVLLPAVQRAREAARTKQSQNNLKHIALALHNYHDAFRTFPPGAVADEDRLYHGWQTFIFPYLDASPYYSMVDFDYTWDDPYNLPVFRAELPVYLNPSIVETRDSQGLPVTHYSVSSHLFGRNSRSPVPEITDGTATTILGGEIGDGFPAWGCPGNWRDPALGLKSDPDSFGVSWREDVNLVMVDGNVRPISQGVDSRILKALSSPAGGEQLPSGF